MRIAILVVLCLVGCVVGSTPPSPIVKVSSPQRGMVQSETGQVAVSGTTLPGSDGARITRVAVNGVPATLSADGSFTAVVEVRAGATLLETVASSESGGRGT